jgi:hypothetical protein
LHVLALTGACVGGDTGEFVTTTTVDTIGGTVRVRNSGQPEMWQAVERLTLGSAGMGDIAEEQIFGRISNVIADAEGGIFVADGRSLDVRMFDESGTFVRRFGASGAGPGEFRGLQSIAWLGDTLLALDPGNARLGMLEPNGAWIDHRPYMPLTGGSIRLHAVGARDVYMPFIGRVGEGRGLVFVRQTPDGPRDTLSGDYFAAGGASSASLGDRLRELTVLCRHNAGGGISTYSADLAPRAFLLPAPDALRAFAWGADFRIALIDAAGDTTRVIERDLVSGPLSDEEWGQEQERFQEFLDRFSDETCEPRSLPRPAERRVILGITFDDTGRMWIERDAIGQLALDVFAPDGRLLATMDIPAHAERVPPYIRDDRLYLVVTDSLDVEYVKVFDIRGPGADEYSASDVRRPVSGPT